MVFVELPSFTKEVLRLLEDESYQDLQLAIMERPDSGKLIRKGGGLRKIRWKAQGRGKSGGVRVIYYWWVSEDQVLMLDIYPKNEKEDLRAFLLNGQERAETGKAGWRGVEERAYPQRSVTDEQRSQTVFPASALRVAAISGLSRCCLLVTALCGDAPRTRLAPGRKSSATRPCRFIRQALTPDEVKELKKAMEEWIDENEE